MPSPPSPPSGATRRWLPGHSSGSPATSRHAHLADRQPSPPRKRAQIPIARRRPRAAQFNLGLLKCSLVAASARIDPRRSLDFSKPLLNMRTGNLCGPPCSLHCHAARPTRERARPARSAGQDAGDPIDIARARFAVAKVLGAGVDLIRARFAGDRRRTRVRRSGRGSRAKAGGRGGLAERSRSPKQIARATRDNVASCVATCTDHELQ